MDWSSRYVKQFRICQQVVNYEYASEKADGVHKPGSQVRGDLGEAMDFAPDNVLEFILCTSVFEHAPYPWKTFGNYLVRFLKPGGIMVFTVSVSSHSRQLVSLFAHGDSSIIGKIRFYCVTIWSVTVNGGRCRQ
jgi:2-polyprenyl-3-methyl-5-hydroxy-6-metoxy-1,4-benzoquinol methylase